MYFPTSTARQLSTVPALPNIPPESVVDLCPNPKKSLFCTLTRNGLSVWRVRPSALLAFLSRTPASIIDHGENFKAHWSPDGDRIVVQTTESYLVLVSVIYRPDEPVYRIPTLSASAQRSFLAGPGEGFPLNAVHLNFEGVVRVEGLLLSLSPRKDCLLFSTRNPPSVQRIPWPSQDVDWEEDGSETEGGRRRDPLISYENWVINEYDFSWLIEHEVSISKIAFSRATGVETWITSDGRAYFVHLTEVEDPREDEPEPYSDDEDPRARTPRPGRRRTRKRSPSPEHDSPSSQGGGMSYIEIWQGTCVHDFDTPKWVQKQRRIDPDEPLHQRDRKVYVEPKRAVAVAVNAKFSLIAVGMLGGGLRFTNFPSQEGVTPSFQTIEIPNTFNKTTGAVCTLEWSSDGYVLAVGWENGWGIFSVGGRCLVSAFGVDDVADERKFQDMFMYGVSGLFWAPGNFELIVLARRPSEMVDGQLFAIPFAKSATTGQHSPDNTRYAFLQLDDRALVYRGADQPDMSVINPESDVWQHIKIPQTYLATNWPIRYSSLSSDGRLIAIAGRRGLIHFSASSGRWKGFADEMQEQAFAVKGGLLWFHHVLIAAVDVSKTYQIRLYSRDLDLSNQNVLHREVMPAPVVILSLVDNTLLVYSADNTLSHFLIVPTTDSITLHLCGSITFNGIIAAPSAVRMLSWMIPTAQKQLGDPVNDLAVATVLMVVGGQLVLLRPRKSADQEVRYDMQIFADCVEFCWIHLRGITSLENSLWAFDGKGIRVWLNALAIEAPNSTVDGASVKESLSIPLEFYPLSVLMDKGIIIGAEHEAATRSNLPFVMFRHSTSSHLFLQHILKFHLEASQVREAVTFASHYQNLVYFAHALEILLHTVVESDADSDSKSDSEESEVLSNAVEFLDHFDVALDVVVGCARKTEVTRWRRLFDIVGNPKNLFETCLLSGRLKTAGSYLLVLHNLEQLDEKNVDAIRLLQSAIEAKDWQLCRELVRFLHSIDDTGAALRHALAQTGVMDIGDLNISADAT
ncbi:RIC1-domain-containing protein [Dendrothele bispora CBS 962.96]|uniref:RIC1-domain-containing protein n=1 Tax=Dendrothele bispora (strain CBS 962.96) TaxID=1314807 RepID=A0A4S8LHH5_DENBC|nr:RIC1-domain-containing protein [Dendrothele bispora CBS 962.96]